MSELFESLNFPLQPSSSPLTSTTQEAGLDENGSSSRGVLARTKGSSRSEGLKGIQSPSTADLDAAGRVKMLHYPPHTPKTNRREVSIKNASSSNFDQRFTQMTPFFPTSASVSSSSTLLTKPGHVFWHASPSPSQQVRQRNFQAHLSNTSPILPLGSQAFREELLQQQHPDGRNKKEEKNGIEALTELERRDRRNQDAETEPLLPQASSSNRKFSRRTSRRSVGLGLGSVGGGESSLADKGNRTAEGMQQLLADLNQHLSKQENEVDERDVDMGSVDTSANEQTLFDGLGRVFSLERQQQSTLCSRLPALGAVAGHNDTGSSSYCCSSTSITIPAALVDPTDSTTASCPSNSREWSRTKSLPTEMAKPEAVSKRPSMSKANSTHDECRAVLSPRRMQAQSMTTTEGDGCREGAEEGKEQGQTGKQTGVTDIPATRSAFPLMTKENCKAGAPLLRTRTNPAKSRSSSSSVSPPKKSVVKRSARVGLSRHSAGLSQQQQQQQASGPAAPFKRPTRISNVALPPQPVLTSCMPETKDQDVIVIDDSEDEAEKKKTTAMKTTAIAPPRRTSPRKKVIEARERGVTTFVQPKEAGADADASFDSSMDDLMLCDAVDQAEATQEALRLSQQTVDDDSFEMESSDNEAIVRAMEESGW